MAFERVIQTVFTARDNVSATFSAIAAKAQALGTTLNSGALSAGSKSLDELARRTERLAINLTSGNLIGSIRSIVSIGEGAREAAVGVAEAGGAAEGTAGAFVGLAATSVALVAGAAAVGIGLGLVAGKFAEAGISGSAYAAELGAIAERTGLTVEETSRLAFAASQSHTGIDEMQTGLRFLSKNLLEAREGSVEAQSTFRALGFTSKDLAAGLITPHDALLRVASAVASVKNPMDKTGIAVQVFGRGAIALVPFLSRGQAGIRDLEREFDSLGGTVTTADAAVGIAFKEHLAGLGLQVEKVKVQIGDGLTPSLTALLAEASETVGGAERLADYLGRLGKAAGEVAHVDPSTFFRLLISNVETALPVLRDMETVLSGLEAFGKATAPPPAFVSPGSLFGGEKPTDFVARKKAEQAAIQAQQDAAEAAKKHAAEVAKLRAEYDRVVVSTQNLAVSAASAAVIFDVDPSKALATLNAINEAVAKETSAPVLFKIEADRDGALRSVRATVEEVKKFLAGDPLALPLTKVKTTEDLSQFKVAPLADSKALDEIAPKLGEAGVAALAMRQEFEAAGVDVDALNEKLDATGTALGQIDATGAEIGAVLRASFKGAFSPAAGEVRDVSNAVGDLGSTFDGAFSRGIDKIVSGQAAMLTFSKLVDGAAKAVARLALQLIAALVKALLLKAIFSALGIGTVKTPLSYSDVTGSTGGETTPPRAGIGARLGAYASGTPSAAPAPAQAIRVAMYSGGTPAAARAEEARPARGYALGTAGADAPTPRLRVPAYALGASSAAPPRVYVGSFSGGTAGAYSRVVRAAGGWEVPGAASRIDTFRAILSGGETILPTDNGRSPMAHIRAFAARTEQLVGMLGTLTSRAAADPGGRAGGDTFNLAVSALDASGFRGFIRSGDGRRELRLAASAARD